TAAVVVFCCHAISPGGADAPGLLAAAQVAAAGVPWVVAGDFNREPNGFAPAGNVVCPPNGPTFSTTNPTSRYDYAIHGGGAVVTGVRLSLVMSDHMPVAFMF